MLLVGAVLALISSARVDVWRDERAVWLEAVRMSPEKPRPWTNLGRQHALAGNLGAARIALERAVELSYVWTRPLDERRDGRRIALVNLGRLEPVEWQRWFTE